MDKPAEAITVTGVDHVDGDVILVELSDNRTISLTVADVLRLEEERTAS